MWILAQTPEISPVGLTGWTAFGLTGSILCWYFFVRTPATDKMMEKKDEMLLRLVERQDAKDAEKDATILKLIDNQDKKSDAMMSAFNLRSREEREAADARSKQEREANSANIQLVIEHCREETRLALMRHKDDVNEGADRGRREVHS